MYVCIWSFFSCLFFLIIEVYSHPNLWHLSPFALYFIQMMHKQWFFSDTCGFSLQFLSLIFDLFQFFFSSFFYNDGYTMYYHTSIPNQLINSLSRVLIVFSGDWTGLNGHNLPIPGEGYQDIPGQARSIDWRLILRHLNTSNITLL